MERLYLLGSLVSIFNDENEDIQYTCDEKGDKDIQVYSRNGRQRVRVLLDIIERCMDVVSIQQSKQGDHCFPKIRELKQKKALKRGGGGGGGGD